MFIPFFKTPVFPRAAALIRRLPVLRVGALLLLATLARAQSTAPPVSLPAATPRTIKLVNSPTTATANVAPVIPPLSIYESCRLLGEALQLLGQDTPSAAAIKASRTDRILQAVSSYVERVDRAYPTLPQYAWQAAAVDKAPLVKWETQTYSLKNPIPQVTALAIRAHHIDVEIKYIAAIDQNKSKWEFNQLIYVTADQPRPEICFLPLPTRLAQIQIISRSVDPQAKRRARLFIDAGVCSIPESAKQANYHLKMARALLKTSEWPRAAEHIRKAHALLREYQESRRL